MEKQINIGVQKAIESAGSYQKLADFINQRRLAHKTLSKGTVYNWRINKMPIPMDCILIILDSFREISAADFMQTKNEAIKYKVQLCNATRNYGASKKTNRGEN